MRRFACLTIAFLALAACGDSTGPESVAGRYNLVSVNGMPLPVVVVQVLDNKFELTAGHIQLNADLTCSVSITAEVTTDGDVTTETEGDTCTWSQTGTDDCARPVGALRLPSGAAPPRGSATEPSDGVRANHEASG